MQFPHASPDAQAGQALARAPASEPAFAAESTPKKAVLDALARKVAEIERAPESLFGRAFGGVALGASALEAHLPAGGLARGRWHELIAERDAEDAAAATGFAAFLATRCAKRAAIVWIVQRDDLYAPGLMRFGVDANRLIFVRARNDDEALAAMEDALRTRGVSAAVAETSSANMIAGRRLHLAAQMERSVGLIIRRKLFAARKEDEPSAAASRWRIVSAPSDAGEEPGLGAPRWKVRLERCRGGRPGEWILENCHEAGDVRVVAELGDHAAATAVRRFA